eukprot:TRINITY_DN2138_c0_g2_i1.p1 TRINITY_DN2138_c0_g2~~TRINITY_DN2138_c0_g2_i1.p1  ORF type:complete len:198 (-),score=33.63 TRINITY_DN2138_c0_g2_i1:3-596(-)
MDYMKSLGASIVSVSLPHTPYALSAYYILAPAEASSNLARYDGIRYGYREDGDTIEEMLLKSRTSGFGEEVQRRILIGSFVLSRKSYESYYKKAQQIRRLVCEDFSAVFKGPNNPEGVDVLLTPTTPTTALSLNECLAGKINPVSLYVNDVFTIPASMAGLPAISVPFKLDSGLPFGLQLISKQLEEAGLLLSLIHI